MTDNIPSSQLPEKGYNLPTENEPMQLDDARRVKVLSPGMLVFKRFIRNKLAVVGFVIIFFMFTFAFFGPLLSPYTQTEVFKGIGSMSKDYAGATYNQELRYTIVEGEQFGSSERAQFLLALGKGEKTFTNNGDIYYYDRIANNVYRILQLDVVAEALGGVFKIAPGVQVPVGLEEVFKEAVADKKTSFSYEGIPYRIIQNKKAQQITVERDVALAMLDVYDAYDQADAPIVSSYDFKLASIRAITIKKRVFSLGNQTYNIQYDEGRTTIVKDSGTPIAEVSDIIVNPLDKETFLSVDFKNAVRQAIYENKPEFIFVENGKEVEYDIIRVNTNYNIKVATPTELIRTYEAPSSEHWLGLDNNGMDLMTRLMYGGRVSLLVGFVVIFFEIIIGIIIGGISGYFGGWVDTALMRFVDLVNSIPFYPMVLIFGSVMDVLEVKPMARIFLLMAVLGILGWTGVARVVRGQILSLREQDFMIATEATGIRTSRRIFKHLVPNVMPLMIVSATAGLGGIIISEATLGFLGLGVKYPLASWGSIINVASDAFVMTNYWYMWIPAGLLILLTVLGFNFIGDGLRDAFDPRMKR